MGAVLKSRWMADDVAVGGAAFGGPAGTFFLAVPAGVEAEAGDDEEDVTFARPDADPFALTGVVVAAKTDGGHGAAQKTGGPQDVAGGAGAIEDGIRAGAVAAAVGVGRTGDLVGGGDGGVNLTGCAFRGEGVAHLQRCGFAGDVAVLVAERGATNGGEGEQEKGEAEHDAEKADREARFNLQRLAGAGGGDSSGGRRRRVTNRRPGMAARARPEQMMENSSPWRV
jgi:hypothetical protein